MFQKLFSFRGRIRRNEYAFSVLLFVAVTLILLSILGRSKGHDSDVMIFLNLTLPLFFVVLAQGSKRAHDLGYNGWYQFIPFFIFWMVIADGQSGPNRFGPNPKGIGNDNKFSFEKNGR